jgi:hypothetical protein
MMQNTKPEYIEPTPDLPVSQVETRLYYARKIEKGIGQKLNRIELISIMITPLYNLERTGFLDYRRDQWSLGERIRSLTFLTTRCELPSPRYMYLDKESL